MMRRSWGNDAMPMTRMPRAERGRIFAAAGSLNCGALKVHPRKPAFSGKLQTLHGRFVTYIDGNFKPQGN